MSSRILLEFNGKLTKRVLLDIKSSDCPISGSEFKMCSPQNFIRRTLDDAIQALLSQRSLAFVTVPKAAMAHQEWQQKCHEQAEARARPT